METDTLQTYSPSSSLLRLRGEKERFEWYTMGLDLILSAANALIQSEFIANPLLVQMTLTCSSESTAGTNSISQVKLS